jgi:hypothetical protein
MKLEKEFKPSAKLLFGAQREIYHSTNTSKIIYFLFGVVPLIVILGSVFFYQSWTMVCTYSLMAIAFVSIQLPLTQYWQIKKGLKSNKSANQIQKMTFSEDGFRNFGEGVDINLSWNKIVKIVRSKNFVLFYISNNCAYFLPSHLISNAEFEKISSWAGIDT